MEAINLISQIIIGLGWLAATLWSLRQAIVMTNWRRVIHGLNAVLMVACALTIARQMPVPGILAAIGLLICSLLVLRADRQDKWRWLAMVQFVFALFVASGTPFRGVS